MSPSALAGNGRYARGLRCRPDHTQPHLLGDLAAPMTSGSAVGASRPWGQIQLTIMKFCIRIRYPASSCAGATRSFRQIRAFSRGLPDSGDRGAWRWLVVRISGWRLWGRGSGRGRSRGLPPVLCGTHLARSDAGLVGGHRGRVLGGSGWSGAYREPGRAGWPVQQESTATGADLTGRARTSWDGDLHRRTAVDVLPADGMQEVRGSNPRSSTWRSSHFTSIHVHIGGLTVWPRLRERRGAGGFGAGGVMSPGGAGLLASGAAAGGVLACAGAEL